MSNLPEHARRNYAQQLADEAKSLVPGMERLTSIAEELRADDLYRTLGFDTWERFCADYFGVSKRTANRWIAGSKPKTITAGQGAAAGQNVPLPKSGPLNLEKETDDAEPAPDSTVVPPVAEPPAGPSDTGATDEVEDGPAGDGEAEEEGDSGGGGPADELIERPPSDRVLTARVLAPMHDIAPADAGPRLSADEATFLRQWATETLNAWRVAYKIDQPKPERRQGYSRPAQPPARGTATTDPFTCAHPKDKRKHLGYIIKCDACGVKIA